MTFETEVFLIARFINICKIVLIVSQSTFPEQLGTMLTGFEGDLAMIVSTYYKLLTYFCWHYCSHKRKKKKDQIVNDNFFWVV